MNLTFFKLSPSLFYVDIFQSLRNSSSGRDGGFKLKGKSTDRSMTSSPVGRGELEDALGGVAHITPTDCTNMFTADPAREKHMADRAATFYFVSFSERPSKQVTRSPATGKTQN